MRLAIAEAGKNLKHQYGGPFGACIVKGRRVLAISRNTVLRNDATCHAEINAIKRASRVLSTYDLSGCVIYSTTEPCPMCFGAIHWARIEAIVYGTGISDAKAVGFNELNIPDSEMSSMGGSSIIILGGFLRGECLKLLKDWNKLDGKILY